MKLELRYQAFMTKMAVVDLGRRLRHCPSGESSSNSTPSTSRTVFKPLESFLENCNKPYPWYKCTETVVTTEDAEVIKDYLMSGGPFTDIMVPQMFIKNFVDADSLFIFYNAL